MALELYQSDDKYPISFDDAWRWLEYSRKDSAKVAFNSCGFVESIDFRRFPDKSGKPQGGRPVENIQLTCECLKQWGMMCGTSKGKEIRSYFIECERIAKASHKPKTQIQLLVEIVNQMAQQEQALLQQVEIQKQQEYRIAIIESEQERYNYPSGHSHTVMGFANLQGIKITANEASKKGRLASTLCREKGINVERIHDPRFGKVGMYPEEILVEVFKNA